jgi:response regulator NasT
MRILVADDESIIRMGLKSMLQSLGHEVITANNGREALRRAREYQLDLALLDIKMPMSDGLQVAAALHRYKPLPVIILTAYSADELVREAADLPIHGYLVKPVQQESLGAAIAVAVRRFEELEELRLEKEKLERQLKARKLVDRAKGKLMARGMSEEEAYRTLQSRARQSRQSMDQIALAILRE